MTIPDLPALHEDMTFLTALSEQRADRLVAWLAAGLRDGGTVADAGCGWGEMLLRVVAVAPAATGLGADLDAGSLTEARRRAGERGLAGRVRFELADAAQVLPGDLDAAIAVGASQVWGEPDAEPGPMPYAAALTALRASVRRGGRVLYGEAVWSRPPTPEATAPLGGRDDELVSLPDLLDLATTAGFVVAGVHESTLEEFDEFECGFTAGYARWLADHEPDHPDAETVRTRLADQQRGYFRGYRGVVGLAYLQLLAV